MQIIKHKIDAKMTGKIQIGNNAQNQLILATPVTFKIIRNTERKINAIRPFSLGYNLIMNFNKWCEVLDLNQRPKDYESSALTN